MTDSTIDATCELCGFSASFYGLETDLSSTQVVGPIVAKAAAEGLSDDELNAEHEGTSIASLLASLDSVPDDDFERAHHGLHTMARIGELRDALGYGPVPGTGEVTGLHLSNGGVPKSAVDSVQIARTGVAGDVQSNRIHHGRPLQALCLWSSDVIAALNAEGHPVTAGLAGENITMSGLDWASLRPGSRITVGAIPVLMSAYATPCSKIAAGFVDRNFGRVDHDDQPGWSRLYGIPLAEGTLSIGDIVSVG